MRNFAIDKIIKKHPPLCEAQRHCISFSVFILSHVNKEFCRLGSDLFVLHIFKFQMFSNDILYEKIVPKVVTEKTVKILNLNFKFL